MVNDRVVSGLLEPDATTPMSGLKHDATRGNLAPAKVRLVDPERVVPAKWSRRRTLLFVIGSSLLLWTLIGFGLWLLL
jgi:hypothetical protein